MRPARGLWKIRLLVGVLAGLLGWFSGDVGMAAEAAPDFESQAAAATKAREEGRLLEAVDLYRKALELNSDWAEGWWYLGTVLYDLDRYEEAVKAFDRVVKLMPHHGPSRAMRGLCEFRLERYDEAFRDLKDGRLMGLGDNPSLESVVRYHLAILLTRQSRFEDALEVLEEFAKENTRNVTVIEAFGLAALHLPYLPAEAPPEKREAVLLAGQAHYEFARENFPTAEALFRQLVARYPNDPAAHYAFGFALSTIRGRQGLGREDPIAEFKKTVELDPKHLEATLQLAFEHIASGDYQAAQKYAERAIALQNDSFAAHFALGQSLLEQEAADLNQAIRELETAARLAPDVPEIRFSLVRAYQRAGRAADAAREREEFKRLSELKKAFVEKVLK